MPSTIRRAIPSDADIIRSVHRTSLNQLCHGYYNQQEIDHLCDMSLDQWKEIIEETPLFLVWEERGNILGFGSLKKNGNIWHLYVHPEYNNKGIGRSLLSSLEQQMTKIGLKSSKLNSSLNAINFYKKNGYTELEKIFLNKSSISIAAISMEKSLVAE